MNAKHLLFPLLLGSIVAQAKPITASTATNQVLNFIENKGQITDQYYKSRSDIDFRVGAAGVNMFIGKGQLHYQWAKPLTDKSFDENQPLQTAMYRMDVSLVGANTYAQMVTENKQEYYEQYYSPTLGEQGATARAYQKITYKDVYPDIDWVLYINNNTVEYDFVVRPGGKVADIKLQYSGATTLALDSGGSLTATTPMGTITEHTPYSYEADNKQVASHFVLQDHILSFSVANYSRTLTIDPTLNWATFYGGNGNENTKNGCVAGYGNNNVYLAGYTTSAANIATTGSFQDTLNGTNGIGQDAFLVKFNSAGVPQWATYYGGVTNNLGYSIACDAVGNAFLVGYTLSPGLATAGSYQPSIAGGQDAFLVKFDTTGARQWATYYGGPGGAAEIGQGVACDGSGNVYITGYSSSPSGIATANSYQPALSGSSDAFLAKFSGAGSLQWATYFGGPSADQGFSVSCDANKNVVLAGYTVSQSGIATTNAAQPTYGGGACDGFVAKFDSAGANQWATYYGGAVYDRGSYVTCDGVGNIYLTGQTTSPTAIATPNTVQGTFGGGAGDAFLVKFNPSGVRQWATYYGGTSNDAGLSLSCGPTGAVYLAGNSLSSTNISVPGTFQDNLNGTGNAILVKFDSSGNRQWATYFGGDAADYGYGIYCNGLSKVFLGGQTSSFLKLTTVGSYQAIDGGGSSDAYLAMFDDCTLTVPGTITGNDSVCHGAPNTYSVPAVTDATSYTWILPSGWTGSSSTDSITLNAGSNSDTIKVAANFLCGISPVQTKAIIVHPLPVVTPSGIINVCSGDSVTLSANSGTAYQWLQNGTSINNATSNIYTAHASNQYAVVVTSNGCTDTSASDTVIVHPLPVPIITVNNKTLSTGSYLSYQWNYNNAPITGAVNQTYNIVVDSGNYTVTITDSNGCVGTSLPYNPALGVSNVSGSERAIALYPNPTTGIIYIDATQEVNISVSGIEGKQIANYENVKQIDLGSLPEGIYLLHVTDINGILLSVEKVIKSKNW